MAKKTPEKKEKKPAGNGNNYTAKDIYVLEGLDPVRKRPGMYIGSTGVDGLHHLVWEVVDNSIDEAMAGYARHIRVELLQENRVAVTDDGRGIPVEVHKQTKKSALETVMTTLHAGGKFGGESYKVSGGLHGVGVSVVCALSAWMKAEVCRDGGRYEQEYKRGDPQYKVKKTGKCDMTGTKVTFEPDPEVFKEIVFDRKRIIDHLRQQAFLTKGVKIEVIDERNPENPFYTAFYFEGGLLSFLKYLGRTEKPSQEIPFYVAKAHDKVEVETAFTYNDEIETHELSFANNIYTPDGGMHLTGFRSALTRSLNDYARNEGYAKNGKNGEESFSGDDVREGLVAIISVKLREPQFEGQTKARLGNTEARTAVESVVGEALKDFLERHPQDARRVIEKCLLAMKARKAAKAAKDMVLRKGALEGLTLPGKLADCSSRDPSESELFIVEGDSAGGCFSGDTKVALTDGRNLSFHELVAEHEKGIKHYCYTIEENGSVGIREIVNPRVTKKDATVIEVVLDNGESIVCTPDHKFMLRSGSYKRADRLTRHDSLMPFTRKYSRIGGKITIDGYEMVFDNPDNIIRLTGDEHLDLHRAHIKRTLHHPDVIEKAKMAHQTHEYREKIRKTMLGMREELSERVKKQWEDMAYKEYMKAQSVLAKQQWEDDTLREWRSQKTQKQWTDEFRVQRKRAYNETFQKKALTVLHQIYLKRRDLDIREYNRIRKETNDKSLLRYDTIVERFFDGDEEKLRQGVMHYNHRVQAVWPRSKKIDVYDLEIPGTHNFALASGLFVHNSAKSGRDRRIQAILPLRGKILNVEKARIDKMLVNKEIKSLVVAIGTAIADAFDIAKLRYHKIILMTDADVDGAHIRTLLLTLFYRYFPAIIEGGYLYIAQPPLYRIQAGKEVRYVYSDSEKERTMGELKQSKEQRTKSKAPLAKEENISEEGSISPESEAMSGKRFAMSIQRYKGLGEMNPEQLWETTMNPANRLLKLVAIADAEEADRLFDVLMGEEVEPRKQFIQTHALAVKNLDI